MRKLFALIAIVACSLSARAGNISIYNTTGVNLYLLNVAFNTMPWPGTGLTGGGGSLLIPPGTTVAYFPTPGHLLTALTGVPTTLAASAAYLDYANFGIGPWTCGIGLGGAGLTITVFCPGAGAYFTLTKITDVTTGDVVLRFTTP